MAMLNFFRPEGSEKETRFIIKTSGKLTEDQLRRLLWFIEDGGVSESPYLSDGNGKKVVEIGPPPQYATANSTNLTQIFHNMGIPQVVRAEEFRRNLVSEDKVKEYLKFNKKNWTERYYKRPLRYFSRGRKPGPPVVLPLFEEGIQPLVEFNRRFELGFDDWMLNWLYDMYVNELKRNPKDVALYKLAQVLSSHCRHWEFSGLFIIDDVPMPYSLFDLIKAPLKEIRGNSLVGFHDNSSCIRGFEVNYLMPENPGQFSRFVLRRVTLHPINTAETHNAPTSEEAYEGAGTGVIGMLRDLQGFGRGGHVCFSGAGYGWPHLFLPGYKLPWEVRPKKFRNAHPRDMIIESLKGLILSADEFGFPNLLGWTRSLEMEMPDGRTEAFFKCLLYALGGGVVLDENVNKQELEVDDRQERIGGFFFPTGVGGGSFSSQSSGAMKKANASKAVQRVDPEMGQKNYRVTLALSEMRDKNPAKRIDDQGAGGLGTVTTEGANPLGAEIDLDQVSCGVKNEPDWVKYSAEFQESNIVTSRPKGVSIVQAIARRERCPCDDLGPITGTGHIVVKSSKTGEVLVDHNLKKILGKLPQREYRFETRVEKLLPPDLPDISIADATKLIWGSVNVGSKGFLMHLMDQSVKARTICGPRRGPMQIAIGDAAIYALTHNSPCGMTAALGEQPLKLMIDPAAGIRMSFAEVLSNMAGVYVEDHANVKCSVNWMWAIKFIGEGAALYRAVEALSLFCRELGILNDGKGLGQPYGGKDSLFMMKRLRDEIVKSFRQCVIGGYCTVPDLTKFASSDIKRPGRTKLMYINPSPGKYRLGGSNLLYCHKQLGDESPDIDDPWLFLRCLQAIQLLVREKNILALHDRSDGGWITTISEMAMAHNCGFDVAFPDRDGDCENPLHMLMAEEAGWICEFMPESEALITSLLNSQKIPHHVLGWTTQKKVAIIRHQGQTVFEERTPTLRGWWEATSHQFEIQLRGQECADQRYERSLDREIPAYELTFVPKPTAPEIMVKRNKVKAAVFRTEGSNGDREMTEMAFMAGMEPYDVHDSDLVNGVTTLDRFQVLLPVGGFANRDAGKHGKGWAGTIRFNELVSATTNRFYYRKNTCSYGPCNAMQAFLYLGWAPFPEDPEEIWPKMERNKSILFEHGWINVLILSSPSVAFRNMAGSFVGVYSAHGAGCIQSKDPTFYDRVMNQQLVPMVYADDLGNPTELYPWNLNGSPKGIAGVCSRDGRHTYTMPHWERVLRVETGAWLPEEFQDSLEVSYFLPLFQNLREFAEEHQWDE